MAELIDILDENGVKTSEVATRKEVHRIGLWHRVAILVVMDQHNRILLQQRSNDKVTNPNKWDIAAAGHVDAGENSFVTIIREAREEVGIDLNANLSAADFHNILTYRKESIHELGTEQIIDKQYHDCYLARLPEISINNLVLQTSEVQNVKLCSPEEFLQMLNSKLLVNRQPLYDEIIKIIEAAI